MKKILPVIIVLLFTFSAFALPGFPPSTGVTLTDSTSTTSSTVAASATAVKAAKDAADAKQAALTCDTGKAVLGTGQCSSSVLGTAAYTASTAYAASNASTTVNGQTCALSGTCTITASLPSNPSACSAGQYVTDIAADGTLTCSIPAGGAITNIAATCDGTTDDASTINTALSTLSGTGGGIAMLPYGKVCATTATIILQSNVTLDLNKSTLKYTGASGGTLVGNDVGEIPLMHSGFINGKLDPGANCTAYVMHFRSITNSHIGHLKLVSGNATATVLRVATGGTNELAFLNNSMYNLFEDITEAAYDSRDGNNDGIFANGVVLEGTVSPGTAVTNNEFRGPFILYITGRGYDFVTYADTNHFTGLHEANNAGATSAGTCAIWNSTATPETDAVTGANNFDHLVCTNWSATDPKDGLVLNTVGPIKVTVEFDQPQYWTPIVDNYPTVGSAEITVQYFTAGTGGTIRKYMKGVTGSLAYAPLVLNSAGVSTTITANNNSPAIGINNYTSGSDSYYPRFVMTNYYGTGDGFPNYSMYNMGGSHATPAATATDKVLGYLMFGGSLGTTTQTNTAGIKATSTEEFSAANQATKLDVMLGTHGGNAALTTVATIDSTGINLPTGLTYKINGSSITSTGNVDIASFAWNGSGSAIATTLGKVCRVIKFASTITGVSLSMETSSTTTIKLYKDAFSDSALPTTDITGGNFVTTSAKRGKVDNTLTGWSTGVNVAAGDEICAEVTTNNNATRATLILHGTR